MNKIKRQQRAKVRAKQLRVDRNRPPDLNVKILRDGSVLVPNNKNRSYTSHKMDSDGCVTIGERVYSVVRNENGRTDLKTVSR